MMKPKAFIVLAFLGAGSLALAAPDQKDQKTGQTKPDMREKMKSELGLTADQQKKLEAHRSQHRAQAQQLWAGVKQNREALKTELEKSKLDMGAVKKANTELKDAQNKLADHRLEGILEVREILTADQFKKFMAMGPGGKGGMKGRGGKGGPGGMGGPQGPGGGPSGSQGKGYPGGNPGLEPGGMEEPGEPNAP